MKLSPDDLLQHQRLSDAPSGTAVRFRIVFGAVVAPLIAAAPILRLLLPSNMVLGVASYFAALALAAIAYAVLARIGPRGRVLSAYVAAGAVVALLQLALIPTINALATAGRWRAPQLPFDAPIIFMLLLLLAGAAAGAFFWWIAELKQGPSLAETLDHRDDD